MKVLVLACLHIGTNVKRVTELRHNNFGTDFENFHQLRHKSLTSALSFYMVPNISIELGAYVNINAEVHSLVPKLLVANIDCLFKITLGTFSATHEQLLDVNDRSL